ncbi:MAG: hypothetical protein HYX92_19110 [Chloroflexi bacterium]|nr:hypothetical protein [Chloroflexota bacterium]
MRIGEVIGATTAEFTAECYELNCAPPLGSLVKIVDGGVDIFGVVCWSETESLDPGRRPLALGRDVESEEEIYRENPQLAHLFRTIFRALVVGHHEEESWYHYLPPRPGRVHGFVCVCELEEVRQFTHSFDFLYILTGAKGAVSTDELVAACLRSAAQAHDDRRQFLVGAGKELAILLGGELNRLSAILKRIGHG